MFRFIHITAFLFLILITNGLHAQTKFSLTVDADEIGSEDILIASYSVDGKEKPDDFEEPKFENWRVISGPSVMNSMMSTNGDVSYKTVFTYTIKPTKTGTLTVPKTAAILKGNKLYCSNVTVKVKSTPHVKVQQQQPSAMPFGMSDEALINPNRTMNEGFIRKGENAEAKAKQNIIYKATASKTSCYEGEPILVTYKLYTRLESTLKIVKQPEFTSCSVEELTPRTVTPFVESYNGKEYNCFLSRKVLITPLKTGIISLLPGIIESNVSFLKPTDGFGIPQQEWIAVQTTSNTLNINVKPLPATNEKSFKGAIGRYNIEAKLQKPQSAKGENNEIIITFTGEGNFENVVMPDVSWPKQLEVYEPKEKDTIDKSTYPFAGSKTFTIPVIAKENGLIEIPAFAFTYFDNKENNYKTIYTKPLQLKSEGVVQMENRKAENTTNYYIWLVPFIAVCAGLGFWFNFYRNKKAKPVEKTELIEKQEEEIVIEKPDYQSKYKDLLMIQNDATFYETASSLSSEMLMDKDFEENENLQQIKKLCSEALYYPGALVTKKQIVDLFEDTFNV